MKFEVLKKTASGNLLLLPLQALGEAEKLENKSLAFKGKKAAVVLDVIARVEKPFVLAKPTGEIPVGVVLEKR